MKKCVCGKKHKKIEKIHECIEKKIRHATESRNEYGAITHWEQVNSAGKPETVLYASTVISLFSACVLKSYVAFDGKGRGDALNHDLYGYDPNQGVAVIQSRHAFRRARRHFLGIHKTYSLCGFNEITERPFRHPISPFAVRGAIRAGANSAAVVTAAQKWMWEVTSKQLLSSVRQGDLLLVPERIEPSGESKGHVMTLADSHEIHSSDIRENGRIYALNPRLVHKKGQHAPVAIEGWASVRVAREVEAWNFAIRLGD